MARCCVFRWVICVTLVLHPVISGTNYFAHPFNGGDHHSSGELCNDKCHHHSSTKSESDSIINREFSGDVHHSQSASEPRENTQFHDVKSGIHRHNTFRRIKENTDNRDYQNDEHINDASSHERNSNKRENSNSYIYNISNSSLVTAHGNQRRNIESSNKRNRVKGSTNATFKIVNTLPAHKHQYEVPDMREVTRLSHRPSSDEIVFPGETERPQRLAPRRKFSPVIAEHCQNSMFCTEVPNYPEDYIASLLKNSSSNVSFKFSEDQLPVTTVEQRFGVLPEQEYELCESYEKVAYPKAAKDVELNWFTVINQPKYKQGFRLETCKNEGSACNSVAAFRIGVEARCKQKYVLREMAIVDADGKLNFRRFPLPSCCTCVVKVLE